MHPGFLPTGRLCEINCNKIFDNNYCHSGGNLAKRFDEVNLTAPEVQGCNIAALFFLINCEAYHEYQRKINKG